MASERLSVQQYGWLACSAMLLLAVVAERWLLASRGFPGDAWAARLGESHKSWVIWEITRAYQQVGRPLVAIGEVAVLIWWLWRTGSRRAVQALPIVLLASACCGLIKIVCGPTPMWQGLHHVGTNFPSGVVTFTTATGGYLALVAWRQGRRVLPAVTIAVIAGSGPARVIGGQHLLSDVIGAYMLGAAWLIAAYVYLARVTVTERFSAAYLARRLLSLKSWAARAATDAQGPAHLPGDPEIHRPTPDTA